MPSPAIFTDYPVILCYNYMFTLMKTYPETEVDVMDHLYLQRGCDTPYFVSFLGSRDYRSVQGI